MTETLTITWGTSRGRDTYGYTVASLYDGAGRRRASVNGGGYDMRGAVFGEYLQRDHREKLAALDEATARDLYGLRRWTDESGRAHVSVDGACGFSSVCKIAAAIGLSVRLIDAGRRRDILLIETAEGANNGHA